MSVLGADHVLGRCFRFRIGPPWVYRLVLVDRLPGSPRSVDKHRSRIDELLDIEALQATQQPTRSFDVHALVERIVITREIEEGDKMDNAGDPLTEVASQGLQRRCDGVVIGEVHTDEREIRLHSFSVEADYSVCVAQGGGERAADVPRRSRDQYEGFVHDRAPGPPAREWTVDIEEPKRRAGVPRGRMRPIAAGRIRAMAACLTLRRCYSALLPGQTPVSPSRLSGTERRWCCSARSR